MAGRTVRCAAIAGHRVPYVAHGVPTCGKSRDNSEETMSTRRPHDDDRRQTRRHPVQDLEGSLLFSYRCRILDLSEEGVAVRTRTPLAPGRTYTLKLEHDGRSIHLSGTVAWCRLEGTKSSGDDEKIPVYRAGIELPEGYPGEARSITELIEERAVIRLERRIDGRITLPADVAGRPEEAATFVVRRLSRDGMVLEAVYQPKVKDRLRLLARVDGEVLDLPVEVEEVRPLRGDDGDADRSDRVEISVIFRALEETQQRRLGELIREELGAPIPPRARS